MKNPLNLLAAFGLALGGIFGIAGTMVAGRPLQSMFWAIDGVGLIVATALLAVRFATEDSLFVSGGFLVFALGESVMLTGTAATLAASVPSFAAGTALWSAGLLLISVPSQFALWTRATGLIAAVLFAIVAARIFSGQQLLPTASPLPFFAYPFLVLTFVGWIWFLLKND